MIEVNNNEIYDDNQVRKIIKFQRIFRRRLQFSRKLIDLYETEKKYIQALELMDNQVFLPLNQYLNDENKNILFGHIQSFLILHRTTIINLFEDSVLKKKSNEQFLEEFSLASNALNMYKIYSYNYKAAENLLNKLRETNDIFIQQLEQIENTQQFLFYDLNYLIYYPIARIFHYKNTFIDIEKHTKFDDNYFSQFKRSLKQIKQITSSIDIELENVNFQNELYILSTKLKINDLFSQTRMIEHKSKVDLIDGHSTKRKFFYIITEKIILHSNKFQDVNEITLNHKSYAISYRNTKTIRNQFMIFGQDTTIMISTTTEDEKNVIMQQIQMMAQCLRNRMDQRRGSLNSQVQLITSPNTTNIKLPSFQNQDQETKKHIMQLNHQNLIVKYKALIFRNKRSIYVIKIKIQNQIQLLFMTFTQFQLISKKMTQLFPQITLPKYGQDLKDGIEDRKMKFQMFLTQILHNQDIKKADDQKIDDLFSQIGICKQFYLQNKEKLKYWYEFLQKKDQNISILNQSVQLYMFQIQKLRKRVFIEQDTLKKIYINVNIFNGQIIQTRYNTTTRIYHIFLSIVKKLQLKSYLDFKLCVFLEDTQKFIDLDMDTFIQSIEYDFSQLRFKYFLIKYIFLPVQIEQIDCQMDMIKCEIFFSQIKHLILNQQIILNQESYIRFASIVYFINFLRDNKYTVNKYLKKQYLFQIIPENQIKKTYLDLIIKQIGQNIDFYIQKYNVEEGGEQQENNPLKKLFNKLIFKKKNNMKDEKIQRSIIYSMPPSRQRSISFCSFKEEDIQEMAQVQDTIKTQYEIIQEVQLELFQILNSSNDYGVHLFTFKIDQEFYSQLPFQEIQIKNNEDIVDLAISHKQIQILNKKNKAQILQFEISQIIKSYEWDQYLIIELMFNQIKSYIKLKLQKEKVSQIFQINQLIQDYKDINIMIQQDSKDQKIKVKN